MTLVLTATSPLFVVQSSDRQLSTLGGQPWDFTSNKVVILRASDAIVSMAYTGRAFIRGRPTDAWLAEQVAGRVLEPAQTLGALSHADLGLTLRRLAYAMGNTTPHGWRERTTEIVVGGVQWRRRPRKQLLARPVHYLGRYWTRDEFEFRPVASRDDMKGAYLLTSIGWAEPDDPQRVLEDVYGAGPDQARDVLVAEIRSMASDHPGVIGRDTMSITLAKGREGVTVRYSAADDRQHIYRVGSRELPGSYSPWIVTPTGATAPQLLTGIRWITHDHLKVNFEGVPDPAIFPGPGGTMKAVFGWQAQPRQVPPGWRRYSQPIPPPRGW